MSTTILKSLNQPQQEAVKSLQGPILVIAGAGTGKTRALTHRVAYMITEAGIPASSILAVTFTNKAAGEMKNRIEFLIAKPELVPHWIGTFHSVCARILRSEIRHLGFTSSFTIYDTDDQKRLVREVLSDLKVNDKRITPQGILSRISGAKNELITPEKFAGMADTFLDEITAQCYPRYQSLLKDHNAVDFDDLLMHTVTIFQKHPEILDRYQEQWKFILIDEYQDTNHAQYVFVKLLAEKYRNLCVVGDDWQGIYSWRGADIRNILNFEIDYPEAKTIKLEQNYRSSQIILDAAQDIIDRNTDRTEKKLWTDRTGGEKISVVEVSDERHEALYIAEKIASRSQNYNDYVVLYRTNAQSRSIEEAFLHTGLPYRIVGGIKFYERREIKDMLAYLNLIVNPADRINLMRILNVPARKIGKTSMLAVKEYALQQNIPFNEALSRTGEITGVSTVAKEGIKNLLRLLDTLRTESQHKTTSVLIESILDLADYRTHLLDGTSEGEDRYQNVQELYSVSKKYDDRTPADSLQMFLQEVALVTDLDQVREDDTAVTLMTLHSAKGLEFEHVIMTGLEENLFPHIRSQSDAAAMEEERRLCYVGITRARETVTLITAKQRMLYGNVQVNMPSRFLSDIRADLLDVAGTSPALLDSAVSSGIETLGTSAKVTTKRLFHQSTYKDGEKVRHPAFGDGIVLQSSGMIVSIAFEKNGVRKFVADVAPLERIES